MRNGAGGGTVRFRVGTGWAEVMCDYGAEQYVVPGGKIMVRTVGWVSRRSCDLLTAENHILREVIYSEKSLVRREVTWFEINCFAAGGGADCAKGGDH